MKHSIRAVRILLDEHKKIRGLVRQIEGIDHRAQKMKAGVCAELFMELEIHSLIEEKYVYAPAENLFEEEDEKALIVESFSDHKRIGELIAVLRPMNVVDPQFNAKFNELADEVELHITEEESEVLPVIQNRIGDILHSVYQEMEVERATLLQQPQYRDITAENVQNPSGGEQMRTKKAA